METRVPLTRNQFLALSDLELYHHMLPEPLAKIAGKVGGGDKQLKERLINEMSPAQQAVFTFMIVYFHNVVGWQLFLFGFADDIRRGMLGRIKEGLRFLGDTKLLENITSVEKRYNGLPSIEPDRNLFEDADREYESIKEASFKNATRYIRKHPDEFFIFQDE